MNKFLSLVGLSTFNDKINAKLAKKLNKTSIENTLNSTDVDKALSANQGKLLNDVIKNNKDSISVLEDNVLKNYDLKSINLNDSDFSSITTKQEATTKIVRACAILNKSQFFNFEEKIDDTDTPILKKLFEADGFLFFNFEGNGNHRCIFESTYTILSSVYGKINEIKIAFPISAQRTHKDLRAYMHKQLRPYRHIEIREKGEI